MTKVAQKLPSTIWTCLSIVLAIIIVVGLSIAVKYFVKSKKMDHKLYYLV